MIRGALVLLVLLTACGGGSPDQGSVTREDFRGGTCLVLADELMLLQGYSAQVLIDHPKDPPIDPGDVRFLQDEAGRFRQGLARAEDDVRPRLTAFVAALDELNRLVETGTYAGPDPLTRVRDGAQALIEVCTSS